jgi:serine/threonine protein kinase
MAHLEHPNIVPVYAAGEETPYYYFAMRLVRGGTLEEALRAGITHATALDWGVDICRALAFLHGAGVIHRDLKPTNVLIHDGVALLSDFGLARLRDASTITQLGYVLGTPLYMAPEQTLGENAGPAADCFALGVILYQMLTGAHPFLRHEPAGLPRAEVRTRLFRRIQTAACRRPSEINPEVRPEIEAVLLKALARNSEERFPNGGAMLDALEKAARPEQAGTVQRVVRYEQGSSVRDEAHVANLDRAELRAEAGQPEPAADAVDSTAVVPGAHAEPAPAAARQSAVKSRVGRETQKSLGRYRIVRELGHGGQGVVYEAHDPVLDRTVALKVLRSDAMAEKRMSQLFLQEARLAARLAHPHIITIYDFGVERQQPYLTMQFIEGPSLDRLLAPRRSLPLPFALQVLCQAAEAVGFAHLAGVIHLDVKPGNILAQRLPAALWPAGLPAAGVRGSTVTGGPHLLLTDFTMARVYKAARREPAERLSASMVQGTLQYSAPEQLDDNWDALGPATDIYALGVVFFEMLTGAPPYRSDVPEAMRELVLSAAIAPPSSRVPSLPRGVDELCAAMLQRSVRDRIQTAAGVVERAKRLLQAAGD